MHTGLTEPEELLQYISALSARLGAARDLLTGLGHDPMFHFLRRIGRRLSTELDEMISRVENHDALIESAVRELEAVGTRLERERANAAAVSARLRASAAAERSTAATWRERALRENAEPSALEFFRLSKRAERRYRELSARRDESEALEASLAARAECLQRKLAGLREREALLRAREALAPRESAYAARPSAMHDVAELFERWEARLDTVEALQDEAVFSYEPFTEETLDATEDAALLLELRALKEKTR